jgi:hypothetical protein
MFRLFQIDWYEPICTIDKTMGYLYLSADAGNPKAERGRQWSDPLGGAILPADRLAGRGAITSISGEKATPARRLVGGGKERCGRER